MKKLIFLILGIGSFFNSLVQAKDLKYPIMSISAELKKDADVVIRDYSTALEINSESSAKMRVHIVQTVLTEDGRDQVAFFEAYDKYTKLKIIKAIVYNAYGEEIRRVKSSEIADFSLVSGYTLYDDDRGKSFNFTVASLPYTVEYEYEVQYNGFIGFPAWIPLSSDRKSLQRAELSVDVPVDYNLRYLQFNLATPDSSVAENTKHYIWRISALEAFKDEDYSPNYYEYLPTVFFQLARFSYCGNSGDFSSWKSYGSWVNGLLCGRDVLSAATLAKVRELVDGVTDKKEIVERIYKYMQSHTRYVSIQLGIGGLQPFSATVVDVTGYGDCKALSNYTKALLAAAGIKAYYTAIGIFGAEIVFPKFPSKFQTNHVVLSVPMEKDTLWLECTSQRNPFYYVPASLVNRNALMITDSGGMIVRTPRRNYWENRQDRRIDISLDMVGNATLEVKTTNAGSQVENLFPDVWSPRKEQEEQLYKELSISGLKILDFNFSFSEGDNVTTGSYVKGHVPKLAAKTGSRLFVPVIPVNPFSKILTKPKVRKMDFVVNSGWSDCDTIVYTIPSGFKVETMPQGKIIETEFGQYRLTCNLVGGRLVFVREMCLFENHYPAVKYNSFVDFINSASKADRSSCVILPQ